MIESLPPDLVERLEELGRALDIEQSVSAYGGGRIRITDADRNEVVKNVTSEATQGSSAGSRQGQRSWSRSGGSWSRGAWARRRPAGEPGAFSSEQARSLYAAETRSLAQEYDINCAETQLGIWVAAKSRPLGSRGPSVHFLIALPFNQEIMPRSWCFAGIGNGSKPLGLRHTNFPDASICAFVKEDRTWDYSDGLVALVDIYSVWALRQLHNEVFGWWPGPQLGLGALYRKTEFQPNEFCGCSSGKRYRDCHLASDLLVDEQAAQAEFKRLFRTNYSNRNVPAVVLNAAQNRWRIWPDMRAAYSFRPIDPVR
ncbi:hypothetical protein [Hephaestia mangrovi]|uniref:hypothetical protein n=1 Tax=Hephaestia mangrovi TaxID=2873268 RepID=UPI001CA6987C|nr:hypothetical protein [Hephaestia mangrovi]MBY8828833.1 hypothetical protein [Hephaestia mangrovi]